MTTDPIRPNTVILTLGAVFFLAACGSDGDPGTGPGDTLGSVRVGASTSGDDLDADGYTVALDGSGSRPLGMNGTTTFSDVAPGNREVELDGVAGNCAVEGANPRTVEVTAGAEARGR